MCSIHGNYDEMTVQCNLTEFKMHYLDWTRTTQIFQVHQRPDFEVDYYCLSCLIKKPNLFTVLEQGQSDVDRFIHQTGYTRQVS